MPERECDSGREQATAKDVDETVKPAEYEPASDGHKRARHHAQKCERDRKNSEEAGDCRQFGNEPTNAVGRRERNDQCGYSERRHKRHQQREASRAP